MTKLWCKIWNFFLNMFTSVIEGVGMLLKTVGTVLVDVLGGVTGAVGKVLGIPGGMVSWLLIGGGCYLLLKSQSDEKEVRIAEIQARRQEGYPNV